MIGNQSENRITKLFNLMYPHSSRDGLVQRLEINQLL